MVDSSRYKDRLQAVIIVPRSDAFNISSPNSFLNHPVGFSMLVLSLVAAKRLFSITGTRNLQMNDQAEIGINSRVLQLKSSYQ